MLTHQEYAGIMEQFRAGCVFCSPDPRLSVASSKRFGVCFDAAPLVPGHLIVHSTEHFSCAGTVPEEWLTELEELRRGIRLMLETTFGTVISYEHGRAGHCLSDGPEHRLCHHFHLHFVPVDVDVSGELTRRFKRLGVRDYRDLPALYEDYGDYLYFETAAEVRSYFPVDTAIERHLMRTLIAAGRGTPERADWRAYQDASMLVAGMERLGGRVRELISPAAHPIATEPALP